MSSPAAGILDNRLIRRLVWFGELCVFIARTLGAMPRVLRHHRDQVWQVLADIAFGRGLVAVTASTVLVCLILSASIGVQIGLEGYQGLNVISLAPLAGFLSAFGNTRELAPLITTFGLAAQLGGKFTAQLGAMRISEEIDALEVMSVPALPYLVSTRLVVALLAVVPLHLVALSGAYLATQLTVTVFAHQGIGTYEHYFHAFLTPSDIGFSVVKVVVFAAVVTLVHCYYGFTASEGSSRRSPAPSHHWPTSPRGDRLPTRVRPTQVPPTRVPPRPGIACRWGPASPRWTRSPPTWWTPAPPRRTQQTR